ncbi:MAG TPA: hemerythrin domain-containing protein [Gallionellaceae bacterium]
MFDFLFGRKESETNETAETARKDAPAAPGNGISYDPNLIAELKLDHSHLLSLFANIISTTNQRNEKLLVEQLNEFGQKLRGHLLKENVRFYVYLKNSLRSDENSLAIMQDFSHEMQQIGRAVTDFLHKYISVPQWDDAQWAVFDRDLNAVGKVLGRRIESEEDTLYTLYLPQSGQS